MIVLDGFDPSGLGRELGGRMLVPHELWCCLEVVDVADGLTCLVCGQWRWWRGCREEILRGFVGEHGLVGDVCHILHKWDSPEANVVVSPSAHMYASCIHAGRIHGYRIHAGGIHG